MKVWVIILMFWAGAVMAVEPDEVLDDPVLEQRARDISAGLRCPVCQNESIDESSATIAKDLRLLVRERLTVGDSDDAVVAYIVDRFGEFVLLKPNSRGANLILWFAAPIMFLIALVVGWSVIRRKSGDTDTSLTTEEQARLDQIMRSD